MRNNNTLEGAGIHQVTSCKHCDRVFTCIWGCWGTLCYRADIYCGSTPRWATAGNPPERRSHYTLTTHSQCLPAIQSTLRNTLDIRQIVFRRESICAARLIWSVKSEEHMPRDTLETLEMFCKRTWWKFWNALILQHGIALITYWSFWSCLSEIICHLVHSKWWCVIPIKNCLSNNTSQAL